MWPCSKEGHRLDSEQQCSQWVTVITSSSALMWKTVCSFCVLHRTREILEAEASLGEGSFKGLGAGGCDRQGEAERGWRRENGKGDPITNLD